MQDGGSPDSDYLNMLLFVEVVPWERTNQTFSRNGLDEVEWAEVNDLMVIKSSVGDYHKGWRSDMEKYKASYQETSDLLWYNVGFTVVSVQDVFIPKMDKLFDEKPNNGKEKVVTKLCYSWMTVPLLPSCCGVRLALPYKFNSDR